MMTAIPEHVVGVAGLGVLGGAIVRRLASSGHRVVGFDPDPVAANAAGVPLVGSISELAQRSTVVLLALPDTGALDAVVQELAGSDAVDLTVTDLGTFAVAAKERARQRLEAAGIDMLDTPVSGTAQHAADGTLVFYASGKPHALARLAEVFDTLGRQTFNLGEFGNGTRMKLVANLLVAVHGLAAAEAHNLAGAMDLDPELVQDAISAGTASSTIFELRGPRMIEGRYEPPTASIDVLLKDILLIGEHARSLGADTPLLDAAVPYYVAASEDGRGSLDAASVRESLNTTH